MDTLKIAKRRMCDGMDIRETIECIRQNIKEIIDIVEHVERCKNINGQYIL